MNKTVSIHIKGFPFLIEEEAYKKLEAYLYLLKQMLGDQEGADEIVEDIEIRIAELLNTRKGSKQVVEMKDVEEVLQTLGDPSDYADESENTASFGESKSKSDGQYSSPKSSERKLYRDEENGQLGGVCAGLAAYLNIDVTVIRLIWAGSFFIFGSGFLLYLLLWIIVPAANSSIDRLRMKGKPINVDTVKEEVERAARNVTEKSRSFANKMKGDGKIRKGVSSIGRVFRLGISLFLLFIGFMLSLLLVVILFGKPQFFPAVSTEGFLSLNSLSDLIFNDPFDYQLAQLSVYLAAFSLITFFLLGGIVMMFNLRNRWYRFINLGLISLGIISTIIGFLVASRTARDFTVSGDIEKEIAAISTEQLQIKTMFTSPLSNSDYKVKLNNNDWMLHVEEQSIFSYGIDVYYHPSKDSLFHVLLEKETKADRLQNAVNRAKNIRYGAMISGDTITLPNYFSYPKKDKIRAQDIEVHIYIPKGKSVAIDGEQVSMEPNSEQDDFDDDADEPVVIRGYLKRNGTYRHNY